MQHTYTVNIEHDVYRYFLTTKEYHQGTLNTPCSAERILTSCLYRIVAYIWTLMAEVWTSCILQHTPLLISGGLYQQLNYSLHLVTSSAFIGTVEDLERSVTLQ